MKCVVLATDKGKRLSKRLGDVVAPLLSIRGMPVIEHAINKVQALEEIEKIYVVIDERFKRQFEKWNESYFSCVPVEFVSRSPAKSKNSDSSIKDLAAVVGPEDFNDDLFVFRADSVFSFTLGGFIDFARSLRPNHVVGICRLNGKFKSDRFKVVELDEQRRVIGLPGEPDKFEKIRPVSTNFHFFPKETLALVKDYLKMCNGQSMLEDYIRWLIGKDKVYAYLFEGKWLDISNSDDYAEAVFTF